MVEENKTDRVASNIFTCLFLLFGIFIALLLVALIVLPLLAPDRVPPK
jgi:hypothetical protein